MDTRMHLNSNPRGSRQRVAVIGAGPAGITTAYQLAKAGVQVAVFEADNAVGGLARSFDLWGQRVDLGPHRFFSSHPGVNAVWGEVLGDDYRLVDRLTRIYYRRSFFYYPLQPVNALANMGLFEAGRCVASYLREKINPRGGGDSFESWVVNRFGRRLYEMFFQAYTEKLWGLPCAEIDADFAAQRIKKFSLGEAIKTVLGVATTKHKTLVDCFAYPTGGTGMVYQRMAQHVIEAGGEVHLRCPVARLILRGRQVSGLVLADGRLHACDHVVSTMPLSLLASQCEPPADVAAATAALAYRNTILVYLHVAAADLFPDQWLYVHSPELGMGRVTNFRNWVPELYGDAQTTILALEYWCYDQDALWSRPDAELIALGSQEIRSTGLLGTAQVIDGHVYRIRRCYPVYRRGYKGHLIRVVEHLRGFPNLTPIGRYGAFKYNNQDHSILMGLLAAENIVAGKGHDLWAVNTGDEYQEAAPAAAPRKAA